VIGAKVLQLMHAKYGDDWVVELLYEDCFDWLDWFWRRRREPPLGLIALGSDPFPNCDTTNTMQAARYESGLDNSPMPAQRESNSQSPTRAAACRPAHADQEIDSLHTWL